MADAGVHSFYCSPLPTVVKRRSQGTLPHPAEHGKLDIPSMSASFAPLCDQEFIGDTFSETMITYFLEDIERKATEAGIGQDAETDSCTPCKKFTTESLTTQSVTEEVEKKCSSQCSQ